LKEARDKDFDYEHADYGVTIGRHYNSDYISLYWPIQHIGRRGKMVTQREVRIDTDGSTAWADTFLDRVKGATDCARANTILDNLIQDVYQENAKVWDYSHDYKGVDQKLPTPSFSKVENIQGKDIFIDLNAKPIRVYSEEHAEVLEQGHQRYVFEIHPRFRDRVNALRVEIQDVTNLKDLEKILRREGIRWDHHIYMDPMWD
jgi:hypothetical protein